MPSIWNEKTALAFKEKPNLIERVLTMPAKGVALIALAVALLSLGLHFKGGQSEAAKAIASELVREAMTVGTGGP